MVTKTHAGDHAKPKSVRERAAERNTHATVHQRTSGPPSADDHTADNMMDGISHASLLHSLQLTDELFERLRVFVFEHTGISQLKKTMLQARLIKRLRNLGYSSFEDYCKYLFSPEGERDELHDLINVVTTNKTDFFREPHHFDFLTNRGIPEILKSGILAHRPLRVWSAACSTGQEPYTLAMVLSEYRKKQHDFTWDLLATDISTRVLHLAKEGVYPESEVDPVPHLIRSAYFLRSKDKERPQVKVVREIREQVDFRRLNLMSDSYGFNGTHEIIFCRNVIIYFNKATQVALLRKLYRQLSPGGFLFLGHAESLNGVDVPLEAVGTTVYQKAANPI